MAAKGLIVAALDFGGTNYRLCLARADGDIFRRLDGRSHMELGRERVMSKLTEALVDMLSSVPRGDVIGLGVSAPGPVDMAQGVLLCTPGRPDWARVPLKEIWEERLCIPVYVGNDAKLGALGEHRFGAGKGIDSLAYITVSTGIGGGIIMDGALLTGSSGLAGEIGHVTIEPSGPLCSCGNRGCLEALASGPAIAYAALNRIRAGEESIIPDLVQGDLKSVTSETVALAAQRGDPLAREVLERAGACLGIGVAALVHLFNPQRVIIGGGVSKCGRYFFEPMTREAHKRTMSVFANSFDIMPAGLGDDAPLLGAVALVPNTSGVEA